MGVKNPTTLSLSTFAGGGAALLRPEGQLLLDGGHSATALGGEGSEQMLLRAHAALNDALGHFLLALVFTRHQRQGLKLLSKLNIAVQTSKLADAKSQRCRADLKNSSRKELKMPCILQKLQPQTY